MQHQQQQKSTSVLKIKIIKFQNLNSSPQIKNQ